MGVRISRNNLERMFEDNSLTHRQREFLEHYRELFKELAYAIEDEYQSDLSKKSVAKLAEAFYWLKMAVKEDYGK